MSPSTLPGATIYATYSQTITTTGGVSAYSYSETGTLPSGLTLSNGGSLSGTDSAASQAGSYPITVTATDADGFSGAKSYSLVVNGPTITLSSLTNPIGEAANSQSVTASGGQASYTYAVTTGSLPTGLSLSSAGVLSGTSTHAGTFAFTVTATDANGYTGSQSYSLTPVGPTITITPATLPSVVLGLGYTSQLSSSGGVGSYTYAKTGGSFPSGMSMSSSGLVSATTGLALGAYTFTVTATDADGFTESQLISVSCIL